MNVSTETYPHSAPALPPTQLPPPDEILDREGVAHLLALSPKQVDERVRSRAGVNRIPHHVVGARTIRFIRSEVLAWLQSRPEKPKRRYRLSPRARRALIARNKTRSARSEAQAQ